MSTTTPATNPQLSAFSPQLSPAARPPSALRQLRTLFHRLVEPGTIEDAYGHDLFTEHTAAVAATHATSTRTEGLVDRLQTIWRKIWADKQVTPTEAARYARAHRALAQAAHQTTEQIEHLR